MVDFFQEILPTIAKNKLRTFLTGFTVAWGLLLLIILLAFGNGLKNGVMENFSGRAKNSIAVLPGRTSVGYDGFAPGRQIKFDSKDYELVCNELKGVIKATPRIVESSTLSYGGEYGVWDIEGTNGNIVEIRNITMESGRFINEFDNLERRKVIVINKEIKRVLFKNQDPLGKFIAAGDIMYEVVGVFDKTNRFQDKQETYIPLALSQTLYSEGDEFQVIDFLVKGLDSKEANERYNTYLRHKFAELHRFDPNDRSALFVKNTYEQAMQFTQIIQLIEVFMLIVGLASLLAGIVGVSNIMVITVKERTKEIGIRKAIGAGPRPLIMQIVLESLLITAISGYIGMFIGIGLTEYVNNNYLSNRPDGLIVFKDPSVNMWVIVGATAIIVVSGVMAGLIPALKAAKIKPVVAMRAD